jgi:hypothetical protein
MEPGFGFGATGVVFAGFVPLPVVAVVADSVGLGLSMILPGLALGITGFNVLTRLGFFAGLAVFAGLVTLPGFTFGAAGLADLVSVPGRLFFFVTGFVAGGAVLTSGVFVCFEPRCFVTLPGATAGVDLEHFPVRLNRAGFPNRL